MNNKNSENFKTIEDFFKTKFQNISKSDNYLEDGQKIEIPNIELNHQIINRYRPGIFTKKYVVSIFKNVPLMMILT